MKLDSKKIFEGIGVVISYPAQTLELSQETEEEFRRLLLLDLYQPQVVDLIQQLPNNFFREATVNFYLTLLGSVAYGWAGGSPTTGFVAEMPEDWHNKWRNVAVKSRWLLEHPEVVAACKLATDVKKVFSFFYQLEELAKETKKPSAVVGAFPLLEQVTTLKFKRKHQLVAHNYQELKNEEAQARSLVALLLLRKVIAFS